MKRREFMALVGASAVAWPTSAPAQHPGKPYRIALIHPFAPVETLNEATRTLGYRFFFEEFRRLGCVEGSNVVIDRYSGLGKKSGQLSESGRLGRKAHIYAILAMTASLAASSGQAQEEGHVVNNVPDYVATREYSGPPTRQEKLRHHSGWLRVDGERSSYFEGPGRQVGFTRALDGDRYDSLSIKQEVGTGWTRLESVKTGKLETYLGETCTIWDLVHPSDPIGRRVSFRDCITHDGIQMAHGWAAEDGGIREPPQWRLTSLTRTAVPEEETLPPAELFDWRNFTVFAAPTPSLEAETKPDFVAKMDGGIRILPYGDGVRYRKRHFPWLSTDTKFANGARIIEIVNERNHAALRFRAEAQGAFERLSISGPQILSQDPRSVAGSVAEQKDVIVKFGTLLGQECKITTDMRSERIRTEWRTADGIVLKEEEAGGRAYNPEDWTVVELQRGPVELSEVMPPADIFERARWGLSR
jgi:hypothetical protein